ncbi:MAG: flagellar brake protein [Clostridiaceae bacterium]|jgi:c-di-GMP-binding flagellar brake protein YcgR|nr:flagellar brake protein [Clostridiaceae bacterium]
MLDLKKYFLIGERVQIEHVDLVGELHVYVSQIVDIHDNDYIDVLIPIHKKRDVHLKPDTILKLILLKGDAIYEFRTVLLEKLFGGIPLLRLKVVSEVNKIQRRDFYRLKVMKEIEARLVEDLKAKKFGESFKCNMHDISAGGLLFSSKQELSENDILEFTIDLNGKKHIVFGAIVRRTLNENRKAPYSYGVMYVNTNMTERNAITKFIFEEQRRLIKRGLI